ncbi:glycoside hydrolase [Sedimentibacter sp. zth1]|uniref:glycoside hydrolase n=1 Tax=Sedimentibacter sp. zth1 TaxID=2816908 RepID=UPI001A928D87|nr:glycoside hydrolase [Sedimentibacter sp. zth1]QSX06912.1 glycoside hydrolase [Sedimentibacter sp. zth1]
MAIKKKDIKKMIRGVIQGIIILILLYIIIKAIFTFKTYKPFDASEISYGVNSGFVALSYKGVDREGTESLVSVEKINKQLCALKKSGYITITQEDIINYYLHDKALPEKALYLLFEDGRKDTAIVTQDILEKYNYKATILGYAEKLENEDSRFLNKDELKKLLKNSFWELGTNGYRLEYINVFDKNDNYLGELNSIEFLKQKANIEENYNHYLMDYIRDEYDVPKENFSQMKDRIKIDYTLLNEIYKKEIGFPPKLYVLMHSNSGQFGTNDKVSVINEECIKNNFDINFNREGNSLNNIESSIYNLTRINVHAEWSANHLLMHVLDDTKNDINFIVGDLEKASEWDKIEGEAEFVNDKIILTTKPGSNGLLRLKNNKKYDNINLSVSLEGNNRGEQSIYLRADKELSSYILVEIINNNLIVFSKESNGKQKVNYEINLDEFNIGNNKEVEILLDGNCLNVIIDGKLVVNNLDLKTKLDIGYIYLQSKWNDVYNNTDAKYDVYDDVYDGIFKNLIIKGKNNNMIFDGSLRGVEKVVYNAKDLWFKVTNWFIKVF